ncbi:unnamed protein product [marine sediment metagenome]|jgi:flagellar hook assembly protein FlgD|uniref:FlgD Ig-like domain-containing protein n=1 Tax=marine sediment metagenome TaxID=412755 RepID=X1KIQ6_9ZZZZ
MQDVRSKMQDFTLNLYDVSGKIIRSFNLASSFLPLASTISWDGTDQFDRAVPAGVYFVYLESYENSVIEKVIKVD